ncbi:hypothetical protein BGX38DRAFT_314459 [Terfezia claveryi]|nr:hypothetical protein BGX38DRAFT_314459 [Terfezia claveryi]
MMIRSHLEVSLEEYPLGKQIVQTNPAIRMARSRLQGGEGGDNKGSGEMDALQQHTQRSLTLPSPSAILTGGLSPKYSSSGPSPFHFPSHDNTHLNQHSYPHNTSIAEKPYSSISSNEDTSNSHTRSEDSYLSTLERNPIAFIAAAGLMQISNDHSQTFHLPPTTATPAHHVYHYENHPTLSEAGASRLGVGVSEAGGPSHVNSNSNSYPSIHTNTNPYSQNTPSSSYPSLRYTPMFATPRPPPVPAPLPPSLLGLHNAHASGSKGKRKRLDNVVGDPSHLRDKDSEREAVKLAWVKHQQKLAKDRKRWKQARKKSKMITLRVSSERLRELEDRWKENESRNQSLLPAQRDQSGEDLVTTDLVPVKKTPKKERISKPVPKASPSNSRRRFALGWVEVSDDEENVSEGSPNEGVGDEEYQGWVARQFSKKKQGIMVPTKRRGRKVNRPEFSRETLTSSQGQGPSESGGNEGYHDADNEGMDVGLFGDHQTPIPASARSETELRRFMEEEEANWKLEEEKRAELERQQEQVEEARKRAEEEAEHARKLAEQKAKEERNWKEEIARAYRESKLLALKVATGKRSQESWWDQEEEADVDEEEEVPVEEILPEWMRFAVVVDTEELLAREAYETFDDNEFTALSKDSSPSVDVPDLDINIDTPPPTSLATAPPPTKDKSRGHPRKHTAKCPVRATASSARSIVNPPISSTNTTTITKWKPHRKSGDDVSALRLLSSSRKKRDLLQQLGGGHPLRQSYSFLELLPPNLLERHLGGSLGLRAIILIVMRRIKIILFLLRCTSMMMSMFLGRLSTLSI